MSLLHAKTLAAELAQGVRDAKVYEWLHDPETWLGDAGAAQLAADPHAASLRTLDIARHHIGPAGAHALAASSYLAHLVELQLGKNPLGDEGLAALAASPHLRRLEVLGLAETGATAQGLSTLMGADLPHLRQLDLGEQWIGPEGAQALAAAPLLRQLRWLDLRGCRVGEAGLRALAASPHLQPGLRLGTFGNLVEGGQWREFTDWNGAVVSEGFEDVSARPDELAKLGIVFPPGVEIS